MLLDGIIFFIFYFFSLGTLITCLWNLQNQLMNEAVLEMQKKVGACFECDRISRSATG